MALRPIVLKLEGETASKQKWARVEQVGALKQNCYRRVQDDGHFGFMTVVIGQSTWQYHRGKLTCPPALWRGFIDIMEHSS
jgi:hypothetical protein